VVQGKLQDGHGGASDAMVHGRLLLTDKYTSGPYPTPAKCVKVFHSCGLGLDFDLGEGL
jgi:hypothetical protein